MAFHSFVFVIALLVEVAALALAIAAATQSGDITAQRNDPGGRNFTCDYRTGLGSRLGFAAAILLLIGQIFITVFSKCACSFRHLRRGIPRIGAIILFILSWLSFLIAELFLITGSARGTYDLKNTVTSSASHCKVIRETIFGIGAGFTLGTLLLGPGAYLCLLRARKYYDKGIPEV